MFEISVASNCPGDIELLLQQHRARMLTLSPSEHVHALDNRGLQDPAVTFFACREGTALAGCAALKRLGEGAAELKSMRTADSYLRRGVALLLLQYVEGFARECGIERLYLETGSAKAFEPAIKLYEKQEFTCCEPFADYALDPHSVFYVKAL
ncbi:MAG: GNAT family N-acetyltransferase [Pseudomonadales bacterium]